MDRRIVNLDDDWKRPEINPRSSHEVCTSTEWCVVGLSQSLFYPTLTFGRFLEDWETL